MLPRILQYDVESAAETIVEFTKKTLERDGLSRLVLGLSTGLDSTTSGYLASKSIGGDNVIGVHLPHNESERSSKEFYRICDLLQLPQRNRHVVDIRPMLEAYPNKGNTLQMTNLLTRVQRGILFDYSHKNSAPLYGTLNRTEYELGEFPIFGLDASFQPIQWIFKTQLKELAAYLGAPKDIQERVPRTDTWQGKDFEIMRTELVHIGISNVDQILAYHLGGLTPIEIAREGFIEKDIDFVLEFRRKNFYKQSLPYVPNILFSK